MAINNTFGELLWHILCIGTRQIQVLGQTNEFLKLQAWPHNMLPLSSRSIQLPAEIASVATAPAPDAPADSPATQSTHASTSTTGTAIHDHVWLTSLVLADILLALDPRLLHNRHCLELGCGTGLASAAAAMAGARVCASDVQPNALRVAASTALRNGTALAECRHLDWRAYHDKEEESDAVVTVDDESVGYHLVIASDVMYMGNAVRPLARTIKRMLGEAGVAVVVDPGRCYCDDFVEVCGGRRQCCACT